jgi:murein DD-endopeptidase MepM/ murein hydrolase activator NlpD
MQHQIEDLIFYTLYGHLSERDLILEPGTLIPSGSTFAHFGTPKENGHWPPHLHFQVILDLQGASGDYPGVCAISERYFYQQNCPNPAIFLPDLVAHAR